MQTFILIAVGVLFITSTLFLFLYFTLKQKYKKSQKEHKELLSKYDLISKSINSLKNELSTKRIGFYQGTTTLKNESQSTTGDVYTYNVHVKELDRYTNGMSKLELIELEIVSGFSPSQYDWVKTCATSNFSKIKKTCDIEWLESEETTKELRKQKLEKLKDIETKL